MIRIENLDLIVGNFALSNVCLDLKQGEYFVLLGSTGSGKTLLIESIAGLNRIDAGRIIIGGMDATWLEPRLRHVGYLPQDYALFPHKTVRGNIEFGLGRRKHIPPHERTRRLKEIMQTVGVEHLADRMPQKLSGGEKQRVALARALVVDPDVLLLDEPVSALDEHTRDGICRELKRIQQEAGTTTIHVCHNFAEMLAVADRVGIIQQGELLQVGTPRQVLERPLNTQVARFVKAGNLLPARMTRDGGLYRLNCDCGLELLWKVKMLDGPEEGDHVSVTAMVRPENISVLSQPPQTALPDAVIVSGKIENIVELGAMVELNVLCNAGGRLVVSLGRNQFDELGIAANDHTFLSIAAENVHVMWE